MADLGEALNVNPDLLFLGGGNPAQIPEFEQLMASELAAIAADEEQLHRLLGVYQSPRGSETLISELCSYFQHLGWPVSEKNICLSSGSQSAFFMLFNLLAGPSECKQLGKILLPMLPEYLGYAGQGLGNNMFVGCAPKLSRVGEHEFKYHCDFDAVEQALRSEHICALCVSRPTNPSGNVHSLETMHRLGQLADSNAVPLIVDGAYGSPFPGIVYDEQALAWQSNRVFVLSLSKLGLPGARTGIVVADEQLISKLSSVNTVLSLANGNLGPALFESLLKKRQLDRLCAETIQPFYAKKREYMLSLIKANWVGLPYRVHRAQGAFFLWLWFENLPISSAQLYERLKARSVLVMDGSHFFFANASTSLHTEQCIRLSYCADDEVLARAITIIGDELKALYSA